MAITSSVQLEFASGAFAVIGAIAGALLVVLTWLLQRQMQTQQTRPGHVRRSLAVGPQARQAVRHADRGRVATGGEFQSIVSGELKQNVMGMLALSDTKLVGFADAR